MDFPGIYQAMRQTEMNEWVGGADPELTGKISAAIPLKYLPIDGTSQVLDFGVGIGRVALSVLKHRPALKLLLGIDIVSRMVDFCRATALGGPGELYWSHGMTRSWPPALTGIPSCAST